MTILAQPSVPHSVTVNSTIHLGPSGPSGPLSLALITCKQHELLFSLKSLDGSLVGADGWMRIEDVKHLLHSPAAVGNGFLNTDLLDSSGLRQQTRAEVYICLLQTAST